MPRLIDADVLKEKILGLTGMFDDGGFYVGMDAVLGMIDFQKTIDPESLRPHGRWVQYDGDSWKCSECGEENCWAYTVIKTVPGVVVQTDRYCPTCGAKMDEEE